MNKTTRFGFSLIELLVVIAIIGILSAIAYPSYNHYITRTRRSDAQVALLDLSNRLERFFTENNTYVGATVTGLGMDATSPEGYYNITITGQTATSFNISAAPLGSQIDDTECATLTLNELGQKGTSGTGSVSDCW